MVPWYCSNKPFYIKFCQLEFGRSVVPWLHVLLSTCMRGLHTPPSSTTYHNHMPFVWCIFRSTSCCNFDLLVVPRSESYLPRYVKNLFNDCKQNTINKITLKINVVRSLRIYIHNRNYLEILLMINNHNFWEYKITHTQPLFTKLSENSLSISLFSEVNFKIVVSTIYHQLVLIYKCVGARSRKCLSS